MTYRLEEFLADCNELVRDPTTDADPWHVRLRGVADHMRAKYPQEHSRRTFRFMLAMLYLADNFPEFHRDAFRTTDFAGGDLLKDHVLRALHALMIVPERHPER